MVFGCRLHSSATTMICIAILQASNPQPKTAAIHCSLLPRRTQYRIPFPAVLCIYAPRVNSAGMALVSPNVFPLLPSKSATDFSIRQHWTPNPMCVPPKGFLSAERQGCRLHGSPCMQGTESSCHVLPELSERGCGSSELTVKVAGGGTQPPHRLRSRELENLKAAKCGDIAEAFTLAIV